MDLLESVSEEASPDEIYSVKLCYISVIFMELMNHLKGSDRYSSESVVAASSAVSQSHTPLLFNKGSLIPLLIFMFPS